MTKGGKKFQAYELITPVSLCVLIVAPRISVLLLFMAIVTLTVLPRLRSPIKIDKVLSILIGLFVIWLTSTIFWIEHDPAEYWPAVKASGLLVVGLTLWSIFPEKNKLSEFVSFRMLVPGVFAGCVIVAVGAIYAVINKTSLWGSFYDDPLSTLNNSAVVISLFSWVAFEAALKKSPIIFALLFILVLGLILNLSSMAAIGVIILGSLVLIVRKITGKYGGVMIALIASFLVVLAPYAVSNYTSDPQSQENREIFSLPTSAEHRLAMWSFATEKIDEKPWLGWGFGASRRIPQEDRRLAPNMEIMPLHPHNLALQTRLELGFPGSLILAGLVFSVFYRLATFTNDGWISGLAMAPAAGWLFVANVSYGMWQSWWIALAFLLAIFMKFALANLQRSIASPDIDL